MASVSFLWALGVSAAVAIFVAVMGGIFTEIGPWYQKLKNPAWKPPDWAFGPIWTTILVMATISSALAWEAAPGGAARLLIVAVLAINSVLNIAWSYIFFKMKRPDWALIEVALLWLSILSLILVLGSYSWTAGLLMVPYILWVSTAALLNLRIVQLNGPFRSA